MYTSAPQHADYSHICSYTAQ